MTGTVEQPIKKDVPPMSFGFGVALEMLQRGVFVQRTGWNGKGMYLLLNKVEGLHQVDDHLADCMHVPQGTAVKFAPYIMMFTATGEFVPWLASQTDILARDWLVVL